MLIIEPKAILWYRRIVLYGSIGLPQAKFTNAMTLGAIVEFSAPLARTDRFPLGSPNGLNLLSTCLGGAADDPILVYALQSINQNPYRPP